MLEFFGYILLIISFVAAGIIIYYTQNYLVALLSLWGGVTVASLMILHFKQV